MGKKEGLVRTVPDDAILQVTWGRPKWQAQDDQKFPKFRKGKRNAPNRKLRKVMKRFTLLRGEHAPVSFSMLVPEAEKVTVLFQRTEFDDSKTSKHYVNK